MLDPSIILIFCIGLVPGVLSSYLALTSLRRYTRQRYDVALERSLNRSSYPPLYLQAQDYHYVEGLGYIMGDITCQFNARSMHLRCAINPSGPCQSCPHYESIQFSDELESSRKSKNL